MEGQMEQTVVAYFDNRRDAELAVEHLIQERGIERTDIFLQAQGQANTAGVRAAGADVESGHPGVGKRGSPQLGGAIELSVDCHGADQDKVLQTLKETGAKRVHSQS
jgi:hypothetical protein